MKKQILLWIFPFYLGMIAVQAQCREDSLFLKRMVSGTDLVEGRAYLLETEQQHRSAGFGKSMFVRAGEKPQFGYNGEITNAVPYAVLGNQPIIFKGTKKENLKIDRKKYPCLVLSFTCGGQQYCAYELQQQKPRSRMYYQLIEADFLKELQAQLVGKVLYVKTANWRVYDEKQMNSNAKLMKAGDGTCKYCPVTVTRVDNDYDDKYIVLFRNGTGSEYCFGNVEFSYDDMNGSLNFMRYFTFENPATKYPDITPGRWKQIMSQKIVKGFTPVEVKIAYGNPDEVFTENDDETWVYYNYGGTDYAISFREDAVDKVISKTSRYY